MGRLVLIDIEGTMSSVAFVKDVLFPLAHRRLPDFVERHLFDPEVNQCIAETISTVMAEEQRMIRREEAVQVLQHWIEIDRKHTALKKLQGLIWLEAYAEDGFESHVYEDVPPRLRQWLDEGRTLAIYSSGSVQAQKLYFAHTSAGDLTGLFSWFFDTTVGQKKETPSYQRILDETGFAPHETVFLSDVPAELDAAREAGIQTLQVVRPGTPPSDRHPTVPDFSGITLEALTS